MADSDAEDVLALTIRRTTLGDWPPIWPTIRDVAREGTTFADSPGLTVVDTNLPATRLYERHGFITLGTAPGAFERPANGTVGLRIMWRDLADGN